MPSTEAILFGASAAEANWMDASNKRPRENPVGFMNKIGANYALNSSFFAPDDFLPVEPRRGADFRKRVSGKTATKRAEASTPGSILGYRLRNLVYGPSDDRQSLSP